MAIPLRVLILEDKAPDAELMLHELRRAGYEPEWHQVETEDDYLAGLDPAPDLILADYTLPQFDALRALHVLQKQGQDTPFVVVTGSASEEAAVECMKQGASDYLLKDRLVRLGEAVRHALEEKRLRDERRQTQSQLRESEHRYRSLFEDSRDAVYITDRDGRTVEVNQAALSLFGYTREEMMEFSLWDLYVQPEERERFRTEIEHTAAVRDFEVKLRRKDGEVRDCLFTWTVRRPEQDGSQGYQGTIRDVTEARRTQERIRGQLNRLNALRTIDMTITASLDPRVTFEVLLERLTSALGVDAVDILTFDRNTRTLTYAAGRGFHTSDVPLAQFKIGEGFAGNAAKNRTTVSVVDLDENWDGLGRPALRHEGFVSYYAAPMLARGTINGVLEIFHRTRLEPDQEWLEFLEALATQGAIAIDNAALFEELYRSNLELSEAYDTTLEGWVKALDLRDKETEGHTQRVTQMTLDLARMVGVKEADVVHIRRGALLHDIGKMAVPDRILRKEGPLTEEEWKVMRRHPEYAFEWLAPIGYLRQALEIPYCHHEKWDGTGYPRGLREEQIPLSARIFAAVDVWDALTSDRPYRPAWSKIKVKEHIIGQAGTHLDPRVVEAFLKMPLLEQ